MNPEGTADPVADLILRIADQDRTAFRALYSQAGAKLMGVAARILGDRSEAEDAVQDALTKIWLNARRFDPARARGMTWAIAILRNLCIDRLRARAPVAEDAAVLEFVGDGRPGAEATLVAAGEAKRISECFGTLEPDRAAAVRGAYLDGLSYEDLAARHAVPLNTMRSWLRRGLQRLRECLQS
ncbi:MAG: sigma-70 family RNA polymerase sigma factor [Paracoccaceae bacterium]